MPPVDLRSDTVTKPSQQMRAAIAHAEVGDDVYGEDPTLNQLQEVAAERTGKEAALFVPSGTMANQIALRVHTEPGDSLIVGQNAHVFLYESGAAAALSGLQFVLVGEGGLFEARDVEDAIYPSDDHFARTRLVCVENTHNRSGGRIFPMKQQLEIAAAARKAGLRLHLDGARIFNASVATGISVARLAAPYDSVAFCLSKGLGAPVGSLLCGSRNFVRRARRVRKMLGGAMRQAGVLAAAGLYALEHNVERLAEDHAHARQLAHGLAGAPGVLGVVEPETNMVCFEVDDAPLRVDRASQRDVRVGAVDKRTIRAVTHLGVNAAAVEYAIENLRAACAE